MVGWAIICLRHRPIQFLWATHSKSIHAFLFMICLTLHTVGNVQDTLTQGAPCVTRLTDSVASVVECYRPSNHIITRISIQTAGLAFGGSGLCFYRIRGDDGSCAKHLTVESYTVVMLLTFILIIIPIPSPPHSFIPGLKPYFSVNPSHRSLPFFFRTDHMDSPDCLLYF